MTLIITVCSLHLLALISPGPDFIMVTKNTLFYSRKSGVYTGLGIAIGNFVHILFSFLGIAVIVSQSVLIFNFVKVLGALYLIFIGFKLLKSKYSYMDVESVNEKKVISSFKSFQMGILSAVLNPKVTLFYLSVFSLVIPTNTNMAFQILLGILLTINTFVYNILLVSFFTQKRVQSIFVNFQKYFNKFFGAVLLLLGVKILISKS